MITVQSAARCTLAGAVLLAVMLGLPGQSLPGPSAHSVAHAATTTSPAAFPHIATWGGYRLPGQAPMYARYNLMVEGAFYSWKNTASLSALRAANPTGTLLAYVDSAVVWYNKLADYNYGPLYAGWYALKAGSTLSAALDATQTVIPVRSTTPFTLYADVLVDSESMHITAIDPVNKTLTVLRGFYSTASTHAAGATIAPHASIPVGGPTLTNADPVNDPAEDRPWLMNLSSSCPRNPATGQRWVDFLANWIHTTVLNGSAPWDGVLLDNTDNRMYYTVDANNDGVNDNGIVNGVNVWAQGVSQLFAQLRAANPGAIVMGNGYPFGIDATANGQSFGENIDFTDPVRYGATMAAYHEHLANAVGRQISFLYPTTSSGVPSLQYMRFTLGSSLLDNGALAYDASNGGVGHGVPWWFDEYNNGAGTVLSAAVGLSNTVLPVVNSAPFHVGDTLMVDDEQLQVTGVSAGQLSVTRGYSQTTPATHTADTVVATAAQVAAGLGYLGQPLGSSYPVAASNVNLLPNGSLGSGMLSPWVLDNATGDASTLARDPRSTVNGLASVAVTVTATTGSDQALNLSQTNLSLAGGSTYALTYWAKSTVPHFVHSSLYSHVTTPGTFEDAMTPVGTSWAPYTVYFSVPQSASDIRLLFGLGDALATTWFANLSLEAIANPVQRRDFTYGSVLVNAGPGTASVPLPAGYCHLRGDQNPTLNDGAPVSTVTLAPQDALIVRTCSGAAVTPTNTPTPSNTATNTATPTNTATATNTPTNTPVPPNTILNSSFEQSYTTTSGAVLPTSWGLNQPTAGQFAWDGTVAHTGSAAARLSSTAGSSALPSFYASPANTTIVPGHAYGASVWAQGQNLTGTTVIKLAWFDGSGHYLSSIQSSPLATGTSTWTQLSVSGVAPSGAAQVQVHLQSAGNSGTAWFDDVSFTDNPPPTPTSTPTNTPTPTSTPTNTNTPTVTPTSPPNTLLNSSFEQSYTATSGSVLPTSWGLNQPSAGQFAWDGTVAHTGLASARLGSSAGSSARPSFYASPLNATIVPGTTYGASVWARGQNLTGTTVIKLAWFSSSGSYVSSVQSAPLITGTSTWTQLSVSGVAPSGAAQVQVHLQSAGNSGTAWFDDVSFTSGSSTKSSSQSGGATIPTSTGTPAATSTPVNTATATGTSTNTATATSTATSTRTSTPTNTVTATGTSTPVPANTATTTSTPAAGTILNSSFEQSYTAANGTLLPASWGVNQPSAGQFAWDPTVAHTGNASARLSNSAGSSALPSFYTTPLNATIVAGHSYSATAWVRGQNLTGSTVLKLAWFDSAGQYLSNVSSPALASGTTSWTPLTVSGVAPVGAVRVQVHLQSAGNSGTAWFDDVSFLSE